MDNIRNNNKPLAIIAIVSFLLVLVTNFLASSLPLNGKTTGEVSDEYPNLFTPTGFTFYIWSVIYLLLIGFVIFQARVLFSNQHRSAENIRKILPLFIINCAANIAWLFAWHHNQVAVSVAIMLVMLFTLIAIHQKMPLPLFKTSIAEKIWIDIAFSIYLGWISIATIANVTTLLVDIDWNGFGLSPETWTVVMIVVGTLLGLVMVYKRNYFYSLVIAWAFYGIMAKRRSAGEDQTSDVIIAATVCSALVIIAVASVFFSRKQQNKAKPSNSIS